MASYRDRTRKSRVRNEVTVQAWLPHNSTGRPTTTCALPGYHIWCGWLVDGEGLMRNHHRCGPHISTAPCSPRFARSTRSSRRPSPRRAEHSNAASSIILRRGAGQLSDEDESGSSSEAAGAPPTTTTERSARQVEEGMAAAEVRFVTPRRQVVAVPPGLSPGDSFAEVPVADAGGRRHHAARAARERRTADAVLAEARNLRPTRRRSSSSTSSARAPS